MAFAKNAPCLGPRSPTQPTCFALPAGAWDTHAHVIGGSPPYPLADSRVYTPPPAPVDRYMVMLDAVGFSYGVVVQISVHGTDNSLLLSALAEHPRRLRAVATVDPHVGAARLKQMALAGVTGLRLTTVGGGDALDQIESMASICEEYGWHLELSVGKGGLPALSPRLKRLRVPFVIDHMAHCSAAYESEENFQAIRELLQETQCWIKLCGAFRPSRTHAPYTDMRPLTAALIAMAPERAIWGTDWPYVGLDDLAALPREGSLLDALFHACQGLEKPQESLRQVLVDNPARLYGLPRGL
jgi:2-pyrone-4,6-dicarboxylate lactonase